MSAVVRAVPTEPEPPHKPVYMVVGQNGTEWGTSTTIHRVVENQILAEDIAAKEKARNPGMRIGVVCLVSEARTVSNPVEVVRFYG